MAKDKSSGSFFQAGYQHPQMVGNMIQNPFNESRGMSSARSSAQHDYERAKMRQQQQQYTQQEVEHNIRLVKGMEEEMKRQEAVESDENIYYLLT